MGAAKRRAQARWSKINCATCKALPGLHGLEQEDYERSNPHTCFVVVPPTPKVFTTSLTVLVPREVGEVIDQLYEFVKKHYATRNDFLEDLLKEGLKAALDAQRRAQAALMAAAEADKAAQQPLIEIADKIPANIADLVLAANTANIADLVLAANKVDA